jgi:hypothetical protein
MRALLRIIAVVVVVAAASTRAGADTDVVVLGPAASGTVGAGPLKQVKSLLLRAQIGPAVDRKIDAACAADPACLTTAGNELSARRVLAVTVAQPTKKELTIGLSLVDVVGKEMIAVRDISTTDQKLGRELLPAIRKFLDEAPTDRAKALFAEGNTHFNLNEMDQALELYKRAYRIKALPAFLFNIAQCHRKLGHFQEAINMYQAYLVGVPNATNKDMVESLITESKTSLAEAQKQDQAKAALAAKVEADRFDAQKKTAVEGRKAKEAEAMAAAERTKAEQARIAHEKETYNRHPLRKWTIVTSVVAAGAIGAGAYFGSQAKQQQQLFDQHFCGDNTHILDDSQLATCKSEQTKGERDALFSNAFMIGGGAALLGSIIVFAIDPGNVSRPETPGTALRLTPTSIHLVVTW